MGIRGQGEHLRIDHFPPGAELDDSHSRMIDAKMGADHRIRNVQQSAEEALPEAMVGKDGNAFFRGIHGTVQAGRFIVIVAMIVQQRIEMVLDTLDAAIEIANTIAPEHLELCVDNPFDYLAKIRHAGSIFMGKYCPEALGDYLAGPNHTLPTSGTARFSSPLSVDDFVKKTQYTYYTADALKKVAKDVAYFAETEGLTGHARSATIRMEEDQ